MEKRLRELNQELESYQKDLDAGIDYKGMTQKYHDDVLKKMDKIEKVLKQAGRKIKYY